MGLKSKAKINRLSDERVVKISDLNTQGVKRSTSKTESAQNLLSKNKMS